MQVCGARMDLLTAAYCVQCGLPRLQSTEKNDRCRSTASTTRFFAGCLLATDATLLLK
ncbi:hypothetical protein IG631_13211 [Alternaria alternata]|nr:hypothetical protein IG631_13211 [Alternaria alternata]